MIRKIVINMTCEIHMLHHATQHVRHDILLCLLYKPSFGCQNLSLYPEFKLIKGLRKAKKKHQRLAELHNSGSVKLRQNRD